MTWFLSGRRKQEQADRDHRIAAAQEAAAQIRKRAEKVGGPLRERLARNYWGETASAIARREV